MAGAGYKLFNTGDVLTAAQVNTYLMQQTVMVFASSAARTSALSGVLAEGMVSYLQDTNTLEVYDGSAWVGATGDITGLTAGTGISISSATGPVPTITNSVATTFDALGDLVVGTGADTFAKLTVGNSGETIVADSSASTGLRWQATQSTQNYIINGGADFWQRGTSAAATLNYLCDRFQFNRSGGVGSSTVSRSTDAPTGFQYSIKNQRDSGNTQTNSLDGYYAIETSQSIPLAGKTVVLSFYAKKGANYSGGDLSVTLSSGTGTDQPYYSFTSLTTVSNTLVPNATLNTSWTRYYVTGTVSSSATQVGFKTSWTPTGTAGADDSVYMTGFQLEVGSVPTTFCRAGGTLAGELAACQRYYQVYGGESEFGEFMGQFYAVSGARLFRTLGVQLRTQSPTITIPAGPYTNWIDQTGVGTRTPTGITAPFASNNHIIVEADGMSGATANAQACWNNTAGKIQISAEL